MTKKLKQLTIKEVINPDDRTIYCVMELQKGKEVCLYSSSAMRRILLFIAEYFN